MLLKSINYEFISLKLSLIKDKANISIPSTSIIFTKLIHVQGITINETF